MLYAAAKFLPRHAKIVEVGSFRGASTAAFIQVLNERPDLTLDCYDISITPELHRVREMCINPERVTLHQKYLPEDLRLGRNDMIFIDGDNGMSAFRDLLIAAINNPLCIAMHDTEGYYNALGSTNAACILLCAKNRRAVLDSQKRDGELTQRGIIFSARHEAWEKEYFF
ncbi:MAG: hypothetical protein ABI443_04950, partial [Chthoniobacterales bacterium]